MRDGQHNFSKAVKAERFQHCAGRCESCGDKLMPNKYEYDHANPVAFGGDASFENCRVLCRECHDKKTYKHDIPTVAKSNRIRSRWEMHRRRMANKFDQET